MRFAIGPLVACCLLATGSAAGADYWPMANGATFHYRNDAGVTRDVTLYAVAALPGWIMRDTSQESPYCSDSEGFFIDPDGDVACGTVMTFCDDMLDPDRFDFEPPLKFLDLPLTVGKSWTCNDISTGFWIFTVVGEQDVTVPAGTFHAMVLSVFTLSGTLPFGGTWYLDRDIGPVILPGGFKMVSWSGIVGAGSESWGAVKSLYR
ncbi:MAG: hypothetical protein ACYDIE_13635 [Candidatus Krumholzibacteriia bacterium]